jgi:hypothetical protein
MAIITNHESDYGKNNCSHEEKIQYTYQIVWYFFIILQILLVFPIND